MSASRVQRHYQHESNGEKWSGRKDLNLRPPGPEPGALARLRYAPTDCYPDEERRSESNQKNSIAPYERPESWLRLRNEYRKLATLQ
jgi:hypothetical protein